MTPAAGQIWRQPRAGAPFVRILRVVGLKLLHVPCDEYGTPVSNHVRNAFVASFVGRNGRSAYSYVKTIGDTA